MQYAKIIREGLRLGEVPAEQKVYGKTNVFKLSDTAGRHYLFSTETVELKEDILTEYEKGLPMFCFLFQKEEITSVIIGIV